eukprot:TRINITY_DN11998_c0_g1_i1.p1 TRINITY_DN11998_c0_g1~~TRINITY_DN11998_c0_g1_i1.p1  ORF type:complete len:362 (-),score=45.14 TRINITY_DN11998_c0_g1_i1:243-1328(-)
MRVCNLAQPVGGWAKAKTRVGVSSECYRRRWRVCQGNRTEKLLFHRHSQSSNSSSRFDEMYRQTISPQPGSEYGEGFVEFRIGGDPVHLDVDTLNEKLASKGRMRLRFAQYPDEAYGMIFSFEGVLADTKKLMQMSWQQLAKENHVTYPSVERPQIFQIPAQRVVIDVLQWTDDWQEAQRLAHRVSQLYHDNFNEQLKRAKGGVLDWLLKLSNCNVPCAIVSCMDKKSLTSVLQSMGLADFFQVMVSAEDGMDTQAQRLLSACVKMHRPPNHCVLYEASPRGITAGHNCSMKVVAVLGDYKAYQLKGADLTCSSMSELAVYNIRRLFANRGTEFMDLRQQQLGTRQLINPKRWTANATIDP